MQQSSGTSRDLLPFVDDGMDGWLAADISLERRRQVRVLQTRSLPTTDFFFCCFCCSGCVRDALMSFFGSTSLYVVYVGGWNCRVGGKLQQRIPRREAK